MPVPDISILPEEYASFDLTLRLSKDLRESAGMLSPLQQRVLVDMFYQIQQNRTASANQLRAAQEEPNAFLVMLSAYLMKLERTIVSALDVATEQSKVSRWAKSNTGVGPIIAAALAAHIDIRIAKTASAIWRYGGFDPTVVWEKGKKRPWNAALKVVFYKLGDSFMKFHNHPDCVYGHVYAARKAVEIRHNDAGLFVDQAVIARARTWKKDAEAPHWYQGCYPAGTTAAASAITTQTERAVYLKSVRGPAGEGLAMLPLGRLELRARRVAVKLFIAHYFEVAYTEHYGQPPPKAYILAHEPDKHTQYIPPPGWPLGE